MSLGVSSPSTRDIGFVLQGHVAQADKEELGTNIEALRRLAPGSEVIVSTWEACSEAAKGLNADSVVLSPDPGPLHSIRVSGETQNNINRQIVSTRAGLERCGRPYAVKMRVDTRLISLGFRDLYANYQDTNGPERLVVPMLFTLDPTMFEQVPMHVSDWFQFGTTQALRSYWNCPFMTPEESVWYGSHAYASHSTHLDKRFYCLFAVEQHLARHHASSLNLSVPRFHNDIKPEVMKAHRTLLARHFVIGDLDQIGLCFPKYEWANQSEFQRLNCVNFYDWLELAAQETELPLSEMERSRIAARKRRKAFARRAYRLARPLWPVLSSPAIKVGVNFMLRRLVAREAKTR